jgi:phage gpG-like protein
MLGGGAVRPAGGRGDLLNLSFEVEGEVQLNRALGVLIDRTTDLSRLWPQVRDLVMEDVGKQFRTEGGHGGTPWPPLNPIYAAWKAAAYGQKPIMVRTGALLKSLTQRGIGDMLFESGRRGMSYGTHLPYAKYHQSPGARRSSLPRRPLIRLTEKTQRGIPKLMQQFLFQSQGGFTRAGF